MCPECGSYKGYYTKYDRTYCNECNADITEDFYGIENKSKPRKYKKSKWHDM